MARRSISDGWFVAAAGGTDVAPESGVEPALFVVGVPREWPSFFVRRWAAENGVLSSGGLLMSAVSRACQTRPK